MSKKLEKKEVLYFVSDIETILVDKLQIPRAISLYPEDDFLAPKIFKIRRADTIDALKKESQSMIENYIKDLALRGGAWNIIYFHNLGRFDGLLLMQYLKEKKEFDVKIIRRDNHIYEISFSIEKNKHVYFRDSYLLIPFTLEEAALGFNNIYKKKEFEFTFEERYQETLWSVEYQEALINYLENDSLVLLELIKNFKDFIEKSFDYELNRKNNLTLSSLTQKIFLKKYFSEKFKTLSNNQDDFIRKAYIGGIVDVYKPYGKKLVMLDVNSLYPYIMKNIKLSMDKPTYYNKLSKEALEHLIKNNSGFVYSMVKCKKDVKKHPLLSIKFEGKNIQPVGTFLGHFHTSEIEYCLANYEDAYTFIPLNGYLWSKNDLKPIFKEYIEKLYNLRLNFKNEANKAKEALCKKMMNSLYGRFGIKLDDTMETEIMTQEAANDIINKENVIVKQEDLLDNDLVILTYKEEKDKTEELLKYRSRIDWAAAITAEARIFMQKIKDTVDVFYTDTDSIVIAEEELPKLISFLGEKKLGGLRIINRIEEGLFIAPKVYWFLDSEGKNHFTIKGLKRETINLGDEELKQVLFDKLELDKKDISLTGEHTTPFALNFKDYTIFEKTKIQTLTLDFNKREKIFENSKWIATKPCTLTIKNKKIEKVKEDKK